MLKLQPDRIPAMETLVRLSVCQQRDSILKDRSGDRAVRTKDST